MHYEILVSDNLTLKSNSAYIQVALYLCEKLDFLSWAIRPFLSDLVTYKVHWQPHTCICIHNAYTYTRTEMLQNTTINTWLIITVYVGQSLSRRWVYNITACYIHKLANFSTSTSFWTKNVHINESLNHRYYIRECNIYMFKSAWNCQIGAVLIAWLLRSYYTIARLINYSQKSIWQFCYC